MYDCFYHLLLVKTKKNSFIDRYAKTQSFNYTGYDSWEFKLIGLEKVYDGSNHQLRNVRFINFQNSDCLEVISSFNNKKLKLIRKEMEETEHATLEEASSFLAGLQEDSILPNFASPISSQIHYD
jgi:hypothetical protein